MWNITVDKTWTTDQKKRLQQMLNRYGFTDNNGNSLAADGVFGPKSMHAIEKMKTYQQHLTKPDPETKALQAHLKGMGFKNADGTPLKVDGIYGPKTDAAYNDFENNFLEGITGGKNTHKTVQTKALPNMPKLTNEQILNTVGYKNGSVQNNLTSNLPDNGATASVKPAADPMSGQKNPDGTWKQVVKPGAWAGSGETSLETIASMSKLYQPYAQAMNMQDRADDYRRQADEYTQKAVEAAEKVRMGLARPEDEYNGLQQQRKYLQDQADAAQKQADDLLKKNGDLKQQMEKLAAEQTSGMLEESELFNSPEEAAADFAKRAMPLTDKTAHEYSAIMTEVQVPEYKDGKMQMVPKYKYGVITSGGLNNVIGNALTGLMTSSEGKKYLLHTHPNSTYCESDNFSGVPILFNDKGAFPFGDSTIPIILGKYGLPFVSNLIAETGLTGYDGIYLAAPSGSLYYYEGLGSGEYHGNTYDELRETKRFNVSNDLQKAKGKWGSGAQSYKPGYWDKGKFNEY